MTGADWKNRTLAFISLIVVIVLCSCYPTASLEKHVLERPMEDVGPVAFHTGQVQVRLWNGTTRLLPYRSCLLPSIINHERVYILPTNNGMLDGKAVVYDIRSDTVKTFPLPEDCDPYFCRPSFSHDGLLVAYYIVSDNKTGMGKVCLRSFPTLGKVHESETYGLRGTDVPPSLPKWSQRSVEFDPDFFDPPRQIRWELQ